MLRWIESKYTVILPLKCVCVCVFLWPMYGVCLWNLLSVPVFIFGWISMFDVLFKKKKSEWERTMSKPFIHSFIQVIVSVDVANRTTLRFYCPAIYILFDAVLCAMSNGECVYGSVSLPFVACISHCHHHSLSPCVRGQWCAHGLFWRHGSQNVSAAAWGRAAVTAAENTDF